MKTKQIRFYSQDENSETVKKTRKSSPKAEPAKGYISTAGKLVLPEKTVSQLGIDSANKRFKVGTQEGKRKIKSLYLIPTDETGAETFTLEKGAKSYSISLAYILKKGGIDYAETKYTFTVKHFDYEGGMSGYELKLSNDSPKPEYTGKPRGRKRQSDLNEG